MVLTHGRLPAGVCFSDPAETKTHCCFQGALVDDAAAPWHRRKVFKPWGKEQRGRGVALGFALTVATMAGFCALAFSTTAWASLGEHAVTTHAEGPAEQKRLRRLEKNDRLQLASKGRQSKRTKRAKKKSSLRSNRYLRIRARRLELTPRAQQRLLRIAKRYYTATKRKLVITGGTRSALRQAQLMYGKLRAGENIQRLYSAIPVRQIIKAYKNGKKKKHARRRIVRSMRDTIRKQMKRGVFISRHLQSGAADVRSRGMSRRQLAAFRRAVAREPGVVLIDERRTSQPHLHLSL